MSATINSISISISISKPISAMNRPGPARLDPNALTTLISLKLSEIRKKVLAIELGKFYKLRVIKV